VSLSPIREDGKLVGVSTIARAITGPGEAESRRRAQEHLLRTTLSSIGDAVITVDAKGRVTFMNAVAERLTGWKVGEAAGRPLPAVFRIVNEKTEQPADDPVARAMREGVIVGLANHTILIARDGARRPIDDSAAPITDGVSVLGAVLVFRDVTERRRAEEARQRLAAIVESSTDAIVAKTLDGRITSWNPGAERVFGYTEAEIVGRPITVLFPPDRLAEEADFLARIARGERVEHYETIRVRKDGRLIHVSVSLSPIRDPDGEIVGASKIARDITERARIAERERDALRQAEEANRMKDEFLATLSHELRTPLNAVFGWVRMLQSGVDEETLRRGLDVIERSSRAQLDLVNDLLDISGIVRGQIKLVFRTVDLRSIVAAAVESIQPSAIAKGSVVSLDTDGTPALVMGDADRLQQVVWNLLTNAVKFTPRGGRVTVSLQRAASQVEVTVQDTGIGIHPEVLPYIFERFRQADSSMTRKFGGLGIGLAIVRHLVELHGGEVRAASEGEGRGAAFVVSLPLAMARSTTGGNHGRRGRISPRLDGLHVLAVDDDAEARDLIATVLRYHGAAVVTVGSATDAMAELGRRSFDCVLTDLGMPVEDGLALARRIRDDERLRDVPLVALTAFARTVDRDSTRSSGFRAHLTKPVEPYELVETVAQVVAEQRQGQRA
jgi:PAS domain S-box-containing protein